MKVPSTFRILTLFIALLTFSRHSVFGRAELVLLMVILLLGSPLAILAQHNSAEIQAKQDAKSDVNKFAWFVGGFIGCASVWTMIALMDRGGYIDSASTLDQSLRCLTVTIPPFLPMVSAIFVSSTPPTERLLGKSPEYVNVYVDSYRKEVKRQRVILSVAGCGVSFVSTPIILLATGVMDLQLY